MQAISPVAASKAVRTPAAQQATGSVEPADPRESRALIPIRPIAASAPAPAMRRYPLAGFLAHLIAVRERAPQTRRRARATPGDATAAYRAAQHLTAPAAQRFRRSA
jgi:hypothetical protein